MSYVIQVISVCASAWGVYDVPGSGDKTYKVSFSGGEGPASCDCLSFKYSKDEVPSCKHIDRVFNGACMFNPQWTLGPKDHLEFVPSRYNRNDFLSDEKCRYCGGPMVAVRVAV